MPAPKPATLLFSLLNAFYVGSFIGEFKEWPPGIEELMSFLYADKRAGASFAIEIFGAKNELPVLLIMEFEPRGEMTPRSGECWIVVMS